MTKIHVAGSIGSNHVPQLWQHKAKPSMSTVIELSLPPSTNRLWRTGRGRVFRSKPYMTWLSTAGWELKAQRPGKIRGPVAIAVVAGRPDQRRRDLDNIASKALLDLLVAHGVVEDDSKVVRIASGWDSAIAPGRISVSITAAN
jgi:Holliday junction resolvase RusA-like endonuclease